MKKIPAKPPLPRNLRSGEKALQDKAKNKAQYDAANRMVCGIFMRLAQRPAEE